MLLLDADIELAPRLVPALLAKMRERDATLVSLMAELHCATFWERLLAPAFVFFFKLLYPFAWSNDAAKATAAAAGGCMLVRTEALRQIGGFAAIRGALIDDCTLAAALKRHRPPIWLGMTHSVRSLRVYASLGDFWSMVARSAFTQLRYSTVWLVVATALLMLTLLAPPAGLAVGLAAAEPRLALTAAAAWLAIAAAYWPVVSFYRLPAAWAATLPVAAALFLAMTWSSAVGYWRGTRASWKARDYGRARADSPLGPSCPLCRLNRAAASCNVDRKSERACRDGTRSRTALVHGVARNRRGRRSRRRRGRDGRARPARTWTPSPSRCSRASSKKRRATGRSRATSSTC